MAVSLYVSIHVECIKLLSLTSDQFLSAQIHKLFDCDLISEIKLVKINAICLILIAFSAYCG
jgi:hypothetical protein